MATFSGLPGVSVVLGLDGEKLSTGLKKADREITQFGSKVTHASGQMRTAFANVGYQLQDLIVGLQAGQRPLTVLIQQGSQIASAFGPAGIAIGTVGTLAAVAASSLLGLSRDTDTATQSTKLFDDTVGGSLDTMDQAIERYRKMSEEVRELERLNLGAILRQQEAAFEGLINQGEAAADSFKRLTELGAAFGTEALGTLRNAELDASIRALVESFEAGRIGLGDLSAAVALARNEAGELADQALVDLDTALRKITTEAVKTSEQMDVTRRNMGLLVGNAADVTRTSQEIAEAQRVQEAAMKKSAKAAGELSGAQRRLAEAGAILLKTSAQEERFDAEAEAMAKRQRELVELQRAQQAAAAEAGKVMENVFTTPAADVADQDLARAMLEEIWCR